MSKRCCCESLIEQFQDKWDWVSLSFNNSLPWTEDFLAKYAEKVQWQGLSYFIKKIPWSDELIARHRDRWDWIMLSANESIPFNESIIRNFAERWDWEQLARNNSFQENILPKITDEMLDEILEQEAEVPF